MSFSTYGWVESISNPLLGKSKEHKADYVRSKELRAAGMDWTAILAAEDDNPRARLAAELLARAAYDSIEARAAAFVAHGGKCRATFFNYRQKLDGGNGTGHPPRE